MSTENPVTAEEFFSTFASEEKLVSLSNGMKFLLKKVDVPQIMADRPMGLPVVGDLEELGKMKPEDKKMLEDAAAKNMEQLMIASVKSPQIIMGDVSIPSENKIAIGDRRFPTGVKTELMGHILEFNGYGQWAKQFFRFVSPGELGNS
jgi:hypothetical protein